MAKYGMSMCVLGMAEELKEDGIAINALWPRTGIYTTHSMTYLSCQYIQLPKYLQCFFDLAKYGYGYRFTQSLKFHN